MNQLWILTVFALLTKGALSLDNGLALTPPMGWLSWERFLCNIDCKNDPKNCISENLYKDMADRLVADGYLEAGYEYVNIDDCWMSKERDSNGRLQADPIRFPSGIKALADYIHGKGLKIGIYEDCGTKTCGGYPGSEDYFIIDAQTFADWGIDMLKLDGCYADAKKMDSIYPTMTAALNLTGRPMVFSCSWPAYQTELKMKPDYIRIGQYCNLWRNYGDIDDSWATVKSIVDYYASVQDDLVPASGPGHWNDPDMLIIGNFGLSLDQARSQMALWSILASPLLMSNDLRDIKPEFRDILLNKEAIAINQDKLGIMGKKVNEVNSVQFWVRPLQALAGGSEYSFGLAIVNRREIGGAVSITVRIRSLGLTSEKGYRVKDIFGNLDLGTYHPDDPLVLKVNPSGVVLLRAEVIE